MKASGAGKRIIITTFGSFGDIHPYIPLALELKARGHRPTIATSELYREKIEANGIGFAALRPNLPSPDDTDAIAELSRRALDTMTGGEFIIKELFVKPIRETYRDLSEASRGADLLVTHMITYAAPLVAEKLKLRWVSTVLAPIHFYSIYDPPVPPQFPSFVKVSRLLAKWSPAVGRAIFGLTKRYVEHWVDEVYKLRAELGLPRGAHPIFEGQHSPTRVLAMFSPLLAAPQPDWPPQTRVTGFCFYDRKDGASQSAHLAPEISRFLDEGEPPIVFTLGSSAVWEPGNFYTEAVEAARRLKRRALLLVGDTTRNMPRETLPEGVAAFDYAPYSELLPRTSVVVHPGGIGTSAQVLRAGKPALVVPFNHDQPDNAERLTRLGVARTLTRKRYNAAQLTTELGQLLDNPTYTDTAAKIGRQVSKEDGAKNASDEIEEVIKRDEG
jgi:UDP:flavonoid glycosyltransferase YjiC (YdhE family)